MGNCGNCDILYIKIIMGNLTNYLNIYVNFPIIANIVFMQPKSCGMLTLSLFVCMLSMAKIGFKLTILQSEVTLFSNMFSKTVILPYCTFANTVIQSTYTVMHQHDAMMWDTVDLNQ